MKELRDYWLLCDFFSYTNTLYGNCIDVGEDSIIVIRMSNTCTNITQSQKMWRIDLLLIELSCVNSWGYPDSELLLQYDLDLCLCVHIQPCFPHIFDQAQSLHKFLSQPQWALTIATFIFIFYFPKRLQHSFIKLLKIESCYSLSHVSHEI